MVGQQLAQALLRISRRPRKNVAAALPVANIAGNWDVEIEFVVGSAIHKFEIDADPASGWHTTTYARNALSVSIAGSRVEITSLHRYEGTSIAYRFIGEIGANTRHMSGEVELGSSGQSAIGPINMKEYGIGRWTARPRPL